MTIINDPQASPADRLAALREHLSGLDLPAMTVESNNHIHTIYSFSPYTPSMACLRGRQAGLQVVGSVDHDSIGAAAEMREAASLLGLGAVTGFECRVKLHSLADVESGRAQFDGVKLNNPDSPGVAYVTVQAIPERSRGAVEEFLRPIRDARLERTRLMTERANEVMAASNVPGLDFDRDVAASSQFAQGGTVTERHLLFAMAHRLIEHWGSGADLVAGLEGMGVRVSAALRATLGEGDNPYLAYDLLGIMKAEYLDTFYVQPDYLERGGELPDAATLVEFALSIGAIPCYAYLGDVTTSPTGDKKAERFEDAFLDDLVAYLGQVGFPAITYMPPRNTSAQLERLTQLCAKHGLIEVSGVDINQPRQSFDCPELSQPQFVHLNTSTWALVAHEMLAADERFGLLSPHHPLAQWPLLARVETYGELGRRLIAGESLMDVTRDLENR